MSQPDYFQMMTAITRCYVEGMKQGERRVSREEMLAAGFDETTFQPLPTLRLVRKEGQQ